MENLGRWELSRNRCAVWSLYEALLLKAWALENMSVVKVGLSMERERHNVCSHGALEWARGVFSKSLT